MSDTPVVSLFIQCLVDSMFPQVGDAMITVFDRLGIGVEYPEEQTCCGQPAYNSGYRREAAQAARRFIEIFEDSEVIVCPSGSCAHMVRHHYPELFRDDAALLERANAVGAKTFELTEYLVDRLGLSTVGARFPHTVTYHDSCHLSRGLGISRQPRSLLYNTSRLHFIEMRDSDTCCGFGGTFSVNYPEISTAMVDEKIENILATGAEVVTGCDISCLMNIQGRLSRRGEKIKVMHIAEILAQQKGEEL
jgi:L-lactate dehydrogenase complex protein LldE